MQYNPQLLNTLKIYSYLKFSQHKDRDVQLHPVQQVTKRQGRSLRHMHTQRLETNITYVLESKGLNVIHEVLQTRPWITEVKNSEQAMLRWKATSFKLEFNNQQLINHFSNHNEITNKQKLFVNIQHNTFLRSHLPQTYIIRKTEDLIKFIQHLKEGVVFLLKPTNQNRGQGIGLFKNLSQLKNLAHDYKEYIIQEYIRPYLIEGRKFDFRIWVLLDQNRKLYWCKEGYLRLSSEKFVYEDTENKYIHLTNWAIQKDHRRFGSRESGNQLSFNQFSKIEPRFQKLIITKFKQIIVSVFELCIAKIDPYHYKGTFELFGFDFMIDPNLNVYLIEINTNPCLERCSNWLKILIPRMLNNLFAIVVDQFFKKQSTNVFPLDGYAIDDNIWYLFLQQKLLKIIKGTIMCTLSIFYIIQYNLRQFNKIKQNMCVGLAFDATCCAGMACCQLACCCCKSCVGSSMKEQVKLTYIIMNITLFLITIFIFYYIQSFLDWNWFIKCPATNNNCFGVSSIYRMSFILCCFYLIMMLLMTFKDAMSRAMNEGLWLMKFVLIGVGFIASLFIQNSFLAGYADFALVISGLYMLFQIIMLVDVFYLWGQKWIKVYEENPEENGYMAYLLIGTTVALYGVALTLNIYNFIWFSGCGVNIFMNIFTLLLIIGFTVVQLLGYNPEGSLLTSSAVACYITFIAYTSQSSCPDKDCNAMYDNTSLVVVESVFGIFMSIVALLYLTFGTTDGNQLVASPAIMDNQKQKDQDSKDAATEGEAQPLTKEQQLDDAKKIVLEHEMEPYKSNQFLVFHTIMFITVVYMSMMFTNWGSSNISNSTKTSYQPSYMAYWIKMITSWLASLIYVWTLIAPHIFPDRDFSSNV